MGTQLVCPEPEHAATSGSLLDRVGVVIPTWKGQQHWRELQQSLDLQGIAPNRIVVVDSSSPDQTPVLARAAGYKVISIAQKDFNHGGTRQLALSYLPEADLIVYLTQDVVFPSRNSILRLCETMSDPKVGAAYGRQLPREQAGSIERHARLFNYPAVSNVRAFEDRHTLGIRTAFFSNSFSVYRRSAIESVGGFPLNVLTAEDSYVVTRLLMEGWKVAYEADATVIHSHPLSIKQEFRRYFETGAQHVRERWILDACGHAGSEGLKFIQSEMRYLATHDKWRIPYALLRTANKLIAYRLGLLSRREPLSPQSPESA